MQLLRSPCRVGAAHCSPGRARPREGADDGCAAGYNDVRVPAENLLGEEGSAFVIAQTRLGGGRVHHAMRTVGMCQRAFDMMCERALSRSTQGETLARKQMVQERIADSWIDKVGGLSRWYIFRMPPLFWANATLLVQIRAAASVLAAAPILTMDRIVFLPIAPTCLPKTCVFPSKPRRRPKYCTLPTRSRQAQIRRRRIGPLDW